MRIWILFLFLLGCKTSVPVLTKIEIRERLVPVVNPADSSLLSALLECDSLGKVRMTEFKEEKTSRVDSKFSLSSNRIVYKVAVVRDTLWMPVRDSLVYKEIVTNTNKVTFFQELQMWIGRLFVAFGMGWLLWRWRLK